VDTVSSKVLDELTSHDPKCVWCYRVNQQQQGPDMISAHCVKSPVNRSPDCALQRHSECAALQYPRSMFPRTKLTGVENGEPVTTFFGEDAEWVKFSYCILASWSVGQIIGYHRCWHISWFRDSAETGAMETAPYFNLS